VHRAWPFEEHVDPIEPVTTPSDFLARSGSGVDAVVVRIGLNGAQLVLVDQTGRWTRFVYDSVEQAESAAGDLGISPHLGEFPEEVRVRMNSYRRPEREYVLGAYPEQGYVGPVRPYPENRPRLIPDAESGPPQP
jgi:hypothetical protein